MNPATLSELVSRFNRFRVAVVGDMMLDRYIWGRASRISQEAPVPVVVVERETESAGGGANVVRNVLALGAQAIAFGIVGDDRRAEVLLSLLQTSGADASGLLTVKGRLTTAKTRVIAGNQQVVRIDREETSPVAADVQAQVEAKLLDAIRAGRVQAVIFEDYAKGLLTGELLQRVTDCARKHGVIVTLDPHPSHPFNIRGLHMMTPNRAEAFGLAGVYYQRGVFPIENDAALLEVSARLRRNWGVDCLLVTLGAGGMALFTESAPPLHIPTRAREVFDVSGAGDTVTAAYTLALLAGASPAESATVANHAAGVVVGKIGTVPIAAADLVLALRADEPGG